MQTSFIAFRGSEDLGDGLSGVFAIESFLRADTGQVGRFDGDAFWSRTSWVGLAHKDYGRILVGRITTPLFVSTLLFNPFVDSFGYSPSIRHYFAGGVVTTGDTGWNDAAMYTSPSYGGATVNLIAAAGEANSNGRNTGGNVVWYSGPIGATFAFQDVKKDAAGPVTDTRTWQLGGSYDFKVAKAFAQLGKVQNKTTGREFDLVSLSATVLAGPGQFIASWGRLKPDVGPKRNTVSAGYQYYLSKRSELYAVGMSDKLDGLSSGRGWSLGIRHRF
jgi:predicted porin